MTGREEAMDDIESRLDKILSDPKAMESIRSLSQMLSESQQELPGGNEVNSTDAAGTIRAQNPADALNIAGLSKLIGGSDETSGSRHSSQTESAASDRTVNAQMITKLLPLITKINQENEKTRFLESLKPIVSVQRRARIDRMKDFMRIMTLIDAGKN